MREEIPITLRRLPAPLGDGRGVASQFRTSYGVTVKQFQYELSRMGAVEAVLEMDLQEFQIRADGKLRKDATPATPGIVVWVKRPGDVAWLSFPSATYRIWTDNLHAVARTLSMLRAIDRYGITKRGQQQFAGFTKMLPAPAMTRSEAAGVLLTAAGQLATDDDRRIVLAGGEYTRGIYRRAMAATHPDRNGGRRLPAYDQVQEAGRVLGVAAAGQLAETTG